MKLNNQNGFTIVQAIFIVVVLGLLGAYMVSISTISQATSTQVVLQARAYQAARAGLEWGIVSSLATWDGISQELWIEGFKVIVTRDVDSFPGVDDSTYVEGGASYVVYPIKSTASFANISSPDYVSRTLEVTIH